MRQSKNFRRDHQPVGRAGCPSKVLTTAGLLRTPANAVLAIAVLALELFAPPSAAAQGSNPAEAVLFEEMPVVEAASLHTQTLQEAPADVTVITADEIRKFGYRTLADALSNVRSLYMSYDSFANFTGVRGFSIPSDLGKRVLVMVNGHSMSSNTHDTNSFGQDFPIDMDLVERIEVIRGPTSALYGSNGIFATINVVTRSPVDHPSARIDSEYGSFGQKEVEVASSLYLGNGANLLLSGSVFDTNGRSVFFDRLNLPQQSSGSANGLEQKQGYRFFSQTIWKNWSFTTAGTAGEFALPNGFLGATFSEDTNRFESRRAFVEATYTKSLAGSKQLKWRVFYDRNRNLIHGQYEPPDMDPYASDIRIGGDWVGSRLSYTLGETPLGPLTVGTDINLDLRSSQEFVVVSPEYFPIASIQKPNISYGFYLQQEWNLARRWTAYLGARVDDSRHHNPFVSPRVALIYQPSSETTYKFMYGRSFRDPNVYEQFFESEPFFLTNPSLDAEKVHTAEVTVERRLGRNLNGLVGFYRYWMNSLIEYGSAGEDAIRFENSGKTTATGVELELNGRPSPWLEMSGSWSFHQVDDSEYRNAGINSPSSIGKVRLAVPLGTRKAHLAGAYRYVSSRKTVMDGQVGAASVFDLTVSTNRLHRSFDIVTGVQNVFNHRYFDPVGAELPFDRYQQRGRTAFVKLVWRTGE